MSPTTRTTRHLQPQRRIVSAGNGRTPRLPLPFWRRLSSGVKLGIIGFQTQYTASPWHGFWIYDTDRVIVETCSAALTVAQPPEIELYACVFDELAAVASHGRAARGIINVVIDELAAEVPDNGGS